jgi:hypothetical protein
MYFSPRAGARLDPTLAHINWHSGHAELPPLAAAKPWLAVKEFGYEPRRGYAAVLHLLARFDEQLQAPADSLLLVQTGALRRAYAPIGSISYPGAGTARILGSRSGLLCRVEFAVSVDVIEYPQAVFSMFAHGRVPVVLPAPLLLSHDGLAAGRGMGLGGVGIRRQLAALAAGCAMVAGSAWPVDVAAAATLKHPAPHRTGIIRPVAVGLPARMQPVTSGPTPKAHGRNGGPQTPTTVSTLTKTSVTSNAASGATPGRRHQKAGGVSGHNPGSSLQCHPLLQSPVPAVAITLENCHSTGPNRRVASGKSPHHHHHHHQSSHPNAAGTHDGGTHQDQSGTGVHAGKGTHHDHSGPRAHHHPSDTPHSPSSHRHKRVTGGSAVSPPAPQTLTPPAPTPPTPPPGPAPAFTPQFTIPTGASTTVGPDEMSATAAWLGVTGSGAAARLNLDPVTSAILSETSLLAAGNQPPAVLIPIYKAAAKRFHVPWEILAASNWIETDYGANLNTSSAGAMGWMQFMPGTWQRYGVAVDGRSQPDPYNPRDAIFSAAHYLAASGAAMNLPKAIYSYNHAAWYVVDVMWRAQLISDHMWRVQLIHDRLRAHTTSWRPGTGPTGLAGAETMLVAAWSAVGGPYSQANHDSFGQTAADLRHAGTDCSGFVSWVLDQIDPGFGNQTTVTLPDQPGIQPGVGKYVTMWDRPLPGDSGHVIINILGTWFESGGNTTFNPAGGIAPMSERQAVGELTGGGFLPYRLKGL